MIYAVFYCKKNGEDKERIREVVGELHKKGFLAVLKESFLALLSPVIILGCIYTGVASPTEAAVISVFYALIISLFAYRTIHLKDIWAILVEVDSDLCTDHVYSGGFRCIFQSIDSDAGSAGNQCMDSRKLYQ